MIFCMFIKIHENQKFIENVLDGHGQKWVWPVLSHGCKIGFISRMNCQNKLIFCMLMQI